MDFGGTDMKPCRLCLCLGLCLGLPRGFRLRLCFSRRLGFLLAILLPLLGRRCFPLLLLSLRFLLLCLLLLLRSLGLLGRLCFLLGLQLCCRRLCSLLLLLLLLQLLL